MINQLRALLLVLAGSWVACSLAYPLAIRGAALLLAPGSAEGSLLRDSAGRIVGSALVAQNFQSPRYFWPRPSAVEYQAAGSGGSNLAPGNPALAQRARRLIERHGATPERPLPAELATASGSGLDPHLTAAGALYQVPRVAAARGLAPERVQALVAAQLRRGAWGGEALVAVLPLNIALDALPAKGDDLPGQP